ncbi:MAG TPA: hypothetical protein VG754_00200 [Verrucomicrobiae bacterium]|jgi:hypothetical protein|nr:hypothetical protein [Verrucomicrobiae bacterium]
MKPKAKNAEEDFDQGRYMNLEKKLRDKGQRREPAHRDAAEREYEDNEESRLQRELRFHARGKPVAQRKHHGGETRLAGGRPAHGQELSDNETVHPGLAAWRFWR